MKSKTTPVVRGLWVIRAQATDRKKDADVRILVRMPREAAEALMVNLAMLLRPASSAHRRAARGASRRTSILRRD